MPILDPSLQFCLLNEFSNKENVNDDFFLRYLQRASIYLFHDLKTIKCQQQFKKDLILKDEFLRAQFDGIASIKEIIKNQISIKNFYSHFYNIITAKYPKNALNVQEGNYYIYKHDNFEMRFFQPFVKYSSQHSWYLTDSPIAILCINLTKIKSEDIISYINLEIDLMSASRFSIVLCVIAELTSDITDFFLINTLKNHNFSEVHFNLIHEDCEENGFYEKIEKCIEQCGYLYLYTTFFKKNKSNNEERKKKLKIPFVKIFYFSCNLLEIFKKKELLKTDEQFVYCKNGFDQKMIRILLCNVPLYKSSNTNIDLIPSSSSGFYFGYVSNEDFYASERSRVKIYFVDNMNFNRLKEKYVDFNDMHLIRPDFYVKNTLFLTRLEKDISEEIGIIGDKNKSKKKITAEMQNLRKSCEKFLQLRNDINFHLNQIYTAFDAVKNKGNERMIYQVETGEGKSIIIQLIASAIAQGNEKVHIVSHNIILSNRDYCESFDFFQKIGLKSAVLLHYNELPNVNFFKSQEEYVKFYPNEFYRKKRFKNSLNMNFCACEKAQIIFSTFSHFEGFYLHNVENFKAQKALTEFKNCILLIDEADSILIDELTHGTIISRPMMTNAEKILKYVYKNKIGKNKEKKARDPQHLLEKIHKKWPNCFDITKEDIEEMYKEIDIVGQPKFTNGIKYSIEKITNENSYLIGNMINKIKPNEKKSENGDKKSGDYYAIVPFDYDHKGILEPNKEFSGFIQQFIAIKERKNDKKYHNLIINDISMNYLYISHQIFVNLYKGVIGLTGTIGNKIDKDILFKNYKINTKKIPRNLPNYRIEFPIILCNDITERNAKIVDEIVEFNKKEIPILVILQYLNEISDLFNALVSAGIKNINIFDGKNEKIKPDIIAGLNGAVSLGTNFCGRGTDIKQSSKPLHVIVSYYTINSRVMNQAFGRTARQGNKGTVRIICLKKEYNQVAKNIDSNEKKGILYEFEVKNRLQKEFIDYFKEKKWIFDINEFKLTDKNQFKFSDDDYKIMRDSKINVNRINAYKYKYPICMSIPTFIEIQSQKIFSIFNCPLCKYTWILFQRYIQETILETWSLLVNQADKEYRRNNNKSYEEILETKIKDAKNELKIIIPEGKNEITHTFIHIFNNVIAKNQSYLMGHFKDPFSNYIDKNFGSQSFISFNFGFKPFSLIDNSGARIESFNDDQKRHFIKDPELKYDEKFSITGAIDFIFEKICQKIDQILCDNLGFKFFLRRTLAGCEFGLCLDMNLEIEIDQKRVFLFDKDILLIFTIFVKSMNQNHFLAAILIIVLVYTATIVKDIFDIITGPGAAKIVIKKLAEMAIDYWTENGMESIFDKIFSKLTEVVQKQLNEIKLVNEKFAMICECLLLIINNKDFAQGGDFLANVIKNNNKSFKLKTKHVNLIDKLPLNSLLKTAILIILALATFVMNFYHHKSVKYDDVTKTYETNNNADADIKMTQTIEKHQLNQLITTQPENK